MTPGLLEVRGPWISSAYFSEDSKSVRRFAGDWLSTGDVAAIDGAGYVTISDRAKDVIKSGGEWISSVALEEAIRGHADVADVAVIAIPDVRWTERPLACVVPRPGATIDLPAIRAHLVGKVERWQMPDAFALVAVLPRTSVGKVDKKALRHGCSSGEFPVSRLTD